MPWTSHGLVKWGRVWCGCQGQRAEFNPIVFTLLFARRWCSILNAVGEESESTGEAWSGLDKSTEHRARRSAARRLVLYQRSTSDYRKLWLLVANLDKIRSFFLRISLFWDLFIFLFWKVLLVWTFVRLWTKCLVWIITRQLSCTETTLHSFEVHWFSGWCGCYFLSAMNSVHLCQKKKKFTGSVLRNWAQI
jgi:hypothetical protein